MNVTTRRLPAFLIGLSLLVPAGCARTPDAAKGGTPAAAAVPAAIVVRPEPVAVRAGETAQLAAQVNDGAGRPIGGAPLRFTITTPTLLRVSDRGAVTALGLAGKGQVLVESGALARTVPVTIAPGAASHIEVVSGADQTAVGGGVLPAPVVVRVVDQFGNRVPETLVTFEAYGGGGAQPPRVTTDDTGQARVSWTLGSAAGPQSLKVSAGAPAVVASIAANATPGTVQRLAKSGGDESPVVAGGTATLRVQALDTFGNPVAGTPVSWSSRTRGAQVLSPEVLTDASGLAATDVRTPAGAGTTTVVARAANVQQEVAFAVRSERAGGQTQEGRPPRAVQAGAAAPK